MLLAARYRKQQYLIGPAIFPIYWTVLKLVLVVVLVGMAIAAVTIAATGRGLGAASASSPQYPLAAISVFRLDDRRLCADRVLRGKCKFHDKWDPRTLPKLSKAEASLHFQFGGWAVLRRLLRSVVAGWTEAPVPHLRTRRRGRSLRTQSGRRSTRCSWCGIVADVVRNSIDVLRPGWEKGQFAFRMLFRAVNLVVLYFLINANDLIVLSDAADPNLQPMMKGLEPGTSHLRSDRCRSITVAQMAWDVYSFFFRGNSNGRRAAASL